MKRFMGELTFYGAALAFYAWFVGSSIVSAGWGGVDWGRYPVFLPSALLVLGAVNHLLRSKVLAWGIFTIGFLCFMALLGACILIVRAKPDPMWIVFFRAMGLYICLAMAGFYQLRATKRQPS